MKKIGKRFLLPVLALPILIVSCTADAYEGPVKGSENIRFENEMKAMAVTRGAVTTLATLDSYGVSAGVHGADGTYAEGQCGNYFRNIEVSADDGETTYLWPATGYEISFYAHAPYGNANVTLSEASTVGRMQYTYTVPDAVASHIDFMTAEVLDIPCPHSETVSLTFSHKLSDFKFRLENSTNQDVTVHSITVMNFDYIGTLNGDTWTTTGVSKNFALDIEQNLASGSSLDLTGTNNHFLLLPQTIASGKRLLDLYVTSGGEDKHFYSDLTQDFVAEVGKSYQFTLRLSSNLEVSQGTDIADWVLYVGYINYATGTNTENWSPEEQPIEHVISGISNWTQEN